MTIKGTADQLFLQVLWMLLDAVFTPTHFYCHSNIIQLKQENNILLII